MTDFNDSPPAEGAAHHFYASRTRSEAPSTYWKKRRNVVDQIKSLAEKVQTTALDSQELTRLEQQLADINTTLENHETLYGRKAWLASGRYGDQGVLHSESTSLIGPANVLSPDLNIWFNEAGQCEAVVEFNWLHEGNPSICHGGFVAAVYDEFLGTAQVLSGKTGMTAYLTTNYFKPTPLNTQLSIRCTIDETDQRKTLMTAYMYDGEVQLSSCEALFITPRKKNDPFKDLADDAQPK